jgi:NAD(P)-dependent dehydrogenase (short-subunit alcohol dehydrogenase family)
MDRRDMLKSLGIAAAARPRRHDRRRGAGGAVARLRPLRLPWDPADPRSRAARTSCRVPDDYFLPGRFEGKTVIVTGSARGMGELAARPRARRRECRRRRHPRGARRLGDRRHHREGGSATFVGGDIAENAVCAEMVRVAVATYGGLDGAINNAGVMDALFPDEPIDYVNQKDRVMARIDEAGDEYWDRVIKVNVYGTFYSLRHEIRQMIAQGAAGPSSTWPRSPASAASAARCPTSPPSTPCRGMTKTAAIDCAAYGIRVNSVGMGTTLTPMFERAFEIIGQRRETGFADTGIGLYKSMSLLQFSDQAKRARRGRAGGDHAVPAVAGSVEHHRVDLQHRRRLHDLLRAVAAHDWDGNGLAPAAVLGVRPAVPAAVADPAGASSAGRPPRGRACARQSLREPSRTCGGSRTCRPCGGGRGRRCAALVDRWPIYH